MDYLGVGRCRISCLNFQPTRDTPQYLTDANNSPFDNDTISIVCFLSSADNCPYFLMRTMQNNIPWYSLFGGHELCIEREGSALQLKRWSRSERCSKLWVALYFLTWEGKQRSGHDMCLHSQLTRA